MSDQGMKPKQVIIHHTANPKKIICGGIPSEISQSQHPLSIDDAVKGGGSISIFDSVADLQERYSQLLERFDYQKRLMSLFVMDAVDKHQYLKLEIMLESGDVDTVGMSKTIIDRKYKMFSDRMVAEKPISLD